MNFDENQFSCVKCSTIRNKSDLKNKRNYVDILWNAFNFN